MPHNAAQAESSALRRKSASIRGDEDGQFDWALVGEADELSALLGAAADLAAVDQSAVQRRLRRLTEVVADRRRYAEVIA